MFHPQPLPITADDDPALSDSAQAWKARQLQILEIMTEAALDLALAAQRQAKTALDTAETAEDRNAGAKLIRAFDGACRTARQCMAFHDRVVAGREIERLKAREEHQARRDARNALIADRRATIGHAVEDTIHDRRRPRAEIERLMADLDEALLDKIPDATFLTAPIGAVVKTICEAIGLPFEHRVWSLTPWAKAETAQRAPGSPFASFRPSVYQRPP